MTTSERRIIQRANELGYFPLAGHADRINRRSVKIHMEKWGHVYDMEPRRRADVAALRRQANAAIPQAIDAAILEVMEEVADERARLAVARPALEADGYFVSEDEE